MNWGMRLGEEEKPLKLLQIKLLASEKNACGLGRFWMLYQSR